ncbi:sensor histidine kinase [Paralcaligenes ureilyticus]|uniref:histidine kinase n=1 Tax=Paralcaligenes ureilyticus TaxID=627131 RepID=A0A4R3MAS2_9BURK|nr:HAMP domain-containing sensor histidine kinase [Paralcaligenes ureilyticus]TCT10232.1 hypothetical protein EDC26_102188 [Paralcaligenes ureilyticus]
MRPNHSLRFKVALVFSALTILLLVSQALGVKTLAEVQEEKFITALIADDMATLIQSYRMDPTLVPPLDQRLGGHVSQESRTHITLPDSVKELQNGIHEIRVGGQEIHVAIASFDQARVYRIYDFSAYEKHFKKTINALMAGTGLFALLTIWLAFGLSGILVRQVAGLARQVKAARLGASTPLNPGKYDEAEVADLVEAFNDYHHRMGQMIQREKEFTSNVSHEFRTPLTAIKTSCELLAQNTAMDTKSAARLRQIDHAADNMIELINVLLLLAREESSANVEPTNLMGAIKDALDPFADRLTTRGITLSIDIDSGLRVEVNRSALAIVLSNLIDNAVRHTERGRISFSYADGWLRIADTGRGIPQHDLAHVFERFYQARPAQEAGRTFGIGLAIVKKISDRYKWSIKLDSTPGTGTCVALLLPAASS